MEDNKVKVENQDNEHVSTSTTLADEQRVKVMSPSMLVFKRFIRNKLAVVGFCILAVMFLFAIVGPIFSPYKETQVFYYYEDTYQNIAKFSKVYQWQFDLEEGTSFQVVYGNLSQLQLEQATSDMIKLNITLAPDSNYYSIKRGQYLFDIVSLQQVATYVKNETGTYTRTSEAVVDDLIYNAMSSALLVPSTSNMWNFTYNGVLYLVEMVTPAVDPANPTVVPTPVYTLSTCKNECVATRLKVYTAAGATMTSTLQNELLRQYYAAVKTPVIIDGVTYTCSAVNAATEMQVTKDGQLFAMITGYVVADAQGGAVDINLMSALAQEAVPLATQGGDETEFTYKDADGKETLYKIVKNLDNYSSTEIPYDIKIEKEQKTLMTTFAPSNKHALGTDKYGMDVLTRLMYGGRISLMVGFVVVAIELLLGVILGGIAGYFSGWVDVIIMRLIELFNCIPFYPMMMILGAVLDAIDVGPSARIFLLMALLGLLGWTGIARIVRGQILSLREQDFIVATEACGIPVSRRIFRHLIPNVIPLLIVNATMSLGGIIITEATLSFLGLGVQHPAASWGTIINQAQSSYEIEQWTWIWIPTGILILLTVLGFNFVGDGLRDAFDPKMKR